MQDRSRYSVAVIPYMTVGGQRGGTGTAAGKGSLPTKMDTKTAYCLITVHPYDHMLS